MERLGFVGLGTMGGPMARHLASLGHPLRVWNRTPERAQPVVDAGAELVGTPQDAALDADAVLTCVADDHALREVVASDTGILAGARAGMVLINLGTVAPDTVRSLADRAASRGVTMIDAGILGNNVHAGQGELRIYVGGPSHTFAQVRPILDQLGKEVTHVGDLGSGMSIKLVLNLLMGLEMQAMAEAVVFGTRLGLDRGLLLNAIAQSGFSSPVMTFKAKRMASGRYDKPDFRLTLMRKDLGLVLDQAQKHGVPMSMTAAAHRTHTEAVNSGRGEQDCAIIIEAVEESAGE